LWPGANGREELALGTVANVSAAWLSGLALADAVDATVPFSSAAFITERGYEAEASYSGQSR
jgi:hypothetical protein